VAIAAGLALAGAALAADPPVTVNTGETLDVSGKTIAASGNNIPAIRAKGGTVTGATVTMTVTDDPSGVDFGAVYSEDGGSVTLTGISITTTGRASGLFSLSGGFVGATGGTIDVSGDRAKGVYAVADNSGGSDIDVDTLTISTNGLLAHGLFAKRSSGTTIDSLATIDAENLTIETEGEKANGIYADVGGDIELIGGAVTTNGASAIGVHAQGADDGMTGFGLVRIEDVDVLTKGRDAYGVFAEQGGEATVDGGSVKTRGYGSTALYADGAGSTITGTDVEIETDIRSAHGAYALAGGVIELEGGSITVHADSEDPGSYPAGYTYGLWAEGTDSRITATGVDITTEDQWSYGVHAWKGGTVEVIGGTITTTGERGYGLSGTGDGDPNTDDGGTIVSSAIIETSGFKAHGAQAYDTSTVTLNGGSVTTTGNEAFGLAAVLAGSKVVSSVDVTTTGTGSHGAGVDRGGVLELRGGTVSAQGAGAAGLFAVNGGRIDVTDTTIESIDGPTVAVSFAQAGKTANLSFGSGAVATENNGRLVDVTRSGDGADGVVNLTLGAGSVTAGDIVDSDTAWAVDDVGGIYVVLEEGATWSGQMIGVRSFETAGGGDVTFLPGTELDELTGNGTTFTFTGDATINGDVTGNGNAYSFSTAGGAVTLITGDFDLGEGSSTTGGTPETPVTVQGDANVGAGSNLGGNFVIQGNLFLKGSFGPGNSPGVVSVGGDFTAGDPLGGDDTIPSALFEVRFGRAAPEAAVDYDQFNVGGDVAGVTVVDIGRLSSSRSTPLGNLGAIELIRIGGELDGAFVLGGRVTQNGHEILLDTRERDATTDLVTGTAATEEEFFDPQGDTAPGLIVIGLRSEIQDESYGLAALSAAASQAGLEILGTYPERRGIGLGGTAEPEGRAWGRIAAAGFDTGDGVSFEQDLIFGQAGVDLLVSGGFRAGVLASYGRSETDVEEAGTLDGDLWAVGVYGTWAEGTSYVDAVLQYGWQEWSFTATTDDVTDVDADGVTAAIEAGHGFVLGDVTVTPWGQLVWQSTSFGDVESDYVDEASFDDADSLTLRGGARVSASFEGIAAYAGVALAHDLLGDDTVTIDGFDMKAGVGGTRLELAAGFEAALSEAVSVYAGLGGATGIGGDDVSAFRGQAGVKIAW
jgi:hypothetical protein